MRKAGEDGTLVCMHAENGIVIDEIVKIALAEGKTSPKYHALTRPTRMEAEGVHRSIAIAEVAGVPVYIVHLSSADALEQVTLARDRGAQVFAETCPQYLFLDISHYDRPSGRSPGDREDFEGAKYVMTPPAAREVEPGTPVARARLRRPAEHLDGHCPFCFKDQKALGIDDFSKIPNGAPGVENRLSLVYNGGVAGGRLSVNKFVELTSTAAAKAVRAVPEEGDDRRRQRRRHRRLQPGPAGDDPASTTCIPTT